MKMTKEAMGRVATASIIGVLAFVVLNRSCGMIPDVVIWWLVYALGCGVVLNTEKGEAQRALARLAILPSLVPVIVLLFFVLADQRVCLSLPTPWIALLFPLASWAGIFVFSFARDPIGSLITFLVNPGTEERTRRLITVVQLMISGLAAIVLALTTLGGRQ
jgi:hypothetical protein